MSVDNKLPQIYQIITALPLSLRSSPNSANPGNVLQDLPTTLLLRRLNNTIYPDDNKGSGVQFIFVAVTTTLSGYIALQQLDASGNVIDVFVGITVSATLADADIIALEERLKALCVNKCESHAKSCKKDKCSSKKDNKACC
jgi:hypothetical protein